MTRRILDRAVWKRRVPFVLLIIAGGLAAAGGLEAHRAVVSNQETAEELIRDYSAFAAWSYTQKTSEAFRRTVEDDVEDVERANWRDASASFLPVRRRGRGRANVVQAGFAFRIPLDPTAGPTDSAQDGPAGPVEPRFAGDEPANSDALAGLIRAHARQAYVADWHFALIYPGNHGVSSPPLAYTVSSGRGEQPQVAYGLSVEKGLLSGLFARSVEREELLPPLLVDDRSNDQLLAIAVADTVGEVWFSTEHDPDPRFAASLELPEHLGPLTVVVSVLPEVAEQLVIGGLPKSRIPLLIGIFGLAAVMTLVAAGQLRREGELARLRSDFVANVSHELRTPLAQIRLYLDTLRLGRAKTEEQRQWSINNMDRETTRLINLVENVLAFSRTGRNQHAGAIEPCDVERQVDEVVRSFEPLARPSETKIVASVPAGTSIRIDDGSLRQVLVNLLDNAIKYGPGGQTVEVSAETDIDVVRISVTDQGPGISNQERVRIWEPYYRGANALTEVTAGSGIGLAVVKEIVERYDGRAVVDDAPTGGARIVLEFPAVEISGESSSVGVEQTTAEHR